MTSTVSSSDIYPVITNVQNKIPSPILLAIVSVLFVFVSVDTYRATDSTLALYEIFTFPLKAYFFSVFEIVILCLCWYLLSTFGFKFNVKPWTRSTLFGTALVCFSLSMLNPNGRSIDTPFGLPKLPFAPENFVYVIFFFTLLFLEESASSNLFLKLFRSIAIVIFIRTFILFTLWSVGEGNQGFYGINATLTEGDSLIIFAFFQVVFFALFLTDHSFIYLFSWFSLMMLQLLSFRRAGLIEAIISNIATLFLFLLWKRKNAMKVFKYFMLILVICSLLVYLVIPSETTDLYWTRYTSLSISAPVSSLASDAGHTVQSFVTLGYAITIGEFWGYGTGYQSRAYVPGAAEGRYVHNVYAAAWIYEGIYSMIFYLLLLLVILYELFGLLFSKSQKDNIDFRVIRAAIIIFFLVMMVAWFFAPISMAESTRMRVFWISIVAFILRFDLEDWESISLHN